MGSAEVQGRLWGARARDWAEIEEPAWRAIFDTALDHAGARAGTRLLDVGCGAGGLLAQARARGAEVAGLDASENLTAIARDRLPGARIEVGDMEALPFETGAFHAVTGINSFQFAADPGRAVAEAGRVCRRGGSVVMLAWGPREECQLITVTMAAVFALLPPAPGPPPAYGQQGVIEGLMRGAGLTPADAGSFAAELAFADAGAALRAVASASARAIAHAGETAVLDAIRGSLAAVTRPDGSVVWRNRFRWVRSTP